MIDWKLATRCCVGCERASRDVAAAMTRRLRRFGTDAPSFTEHRRSSVAAPGHDDWRRSLRIATWSRWFVRSI
jgi:hypothetical protein